MDNNVNIDLKQDLRLASNFLKLRNINHVVIGSHPSNLGVPTILWNLESSDNEGDLYLIFAIGECLNALGAECKIKVGNSIIYSNYEETKRLQPSVN